VVVLILVLVHVPVLVLVLVLVHVPVLVLVHVPVLVLVLVHVLVLVLVLVHVLVLVYAMSGAGAGAPHRKVVAHRGGECPSGVALAGSAPFGRRLSPRIDPLIRETLASHESLSSGK
jgi:hypothetical protein